MLNKPTAAVDLIIHRPASWAHCTVTSDYIIFWIFITCCLFLDRFLCFFVRAASISTAKRYTNLCRWSLLGNLCGALLLYARIDTLKHNKTAENKSKMKLHRRVCVSQQMDRSFGCPLPQTSWIIIIASERARKHTSIVVAAAKRHNAQQMHFWNFSPNCNLNAAHYVIAVHKIRTEQQQPNWNEIFTIVRGQIVSATCNWRWKFRVEMRSLSYGVYHCAFVASSQCTRGAFVRAHVRSWWKELNWILRFALHSNMQVLWHFCEG